ncbi:hypothetical protein [Leisingera caerulea]|uniref:hypothetical protein n=1 Tax=Leisingera caerulea TaxID=506591 RepID=UPI003F4AE49F
MSPKFFDRFTSGILIGWIAALLLASRMDSRVADRVAENWVQFATIIGAMLAALIALIGVQRQIEHGREVERDRRRAALRASRAMLPSILAELSRRCEHNALTVLLNSKNALGADAQTPKHLKKFIGADVQSFLKDHEFQTFKDCIEFADKQSAEVLQYIVRRYQVLYSRCHDGDFPEVNRDRLGRVKSSRSLVLAFEWNTLNMLLEHCLPYARAEEESIGLHFKSWRLSNIFSGSVESEVTSQVRVLSDYLVEAEAMTSSMADSLSDKSGNLSLPYLMKQQFL